MKVTSFGIGILTIIGSVVFFIIKFELYKVEQKGEIVDMKIIKLPTNCDLSRGHYFMDLNYHGKEFSKRIPAGFCHKHKVGELIQMKYLEGIDHALFTDEKLKGEFIAIGIFLLVGIVAVIYGMFFGEKGE